MRFRLTPRIFGLLRKITVLGVVALVLAATGAPSSAHEAGHRADNRSHAWCLSPSTEGKPIVRESMIDAMTNLARQTEMTENGPVDDCTRLTDVRFFEGNADGNRGLWRCIAAQGSVCTASNISINKDLIEADRGPYEMNLHKTACHEVGHSVGLGHHETPDPVDCMESGFVTDTQRTYNPNHIGVINRLH